MAAGTIISAHHPFVKTVAAALRRECGVRSKARILIALSGGADSVALLRTLVALSPRRGWKLNLAVGHVQHHLRELVSKDRVVPDEENPSSPSEADALFSQRLAEHHHLPFFRRDLDLTDPRGQTNVEAQARQARYEALHEMSQSFQGDFVATAHHGDDQLETLLMRLLRGSSVHGLAGMPWQRPLLAESSIRLIRPLLDQDRSAVIDFLQALDQPWREDHTNADITRLRARLRQHLVPVLHEIRSDVAQKTTALTQHMSQLRSLLTDAGKQAAERVAKQRCHGQIVIPRPQSRELPDIVLMELLRNILIEAGASPDTLGQRALGPIVRAIRDTRGGSRTFHLSGGAVMTITRNEVRIA